MVSRLDSPDRSINESDPDISNLSFTTLEGIDSLKYIGNNLILSLNESLIDLSGAGSINFIGSELMIIGNNSISSLHGLDSVHKLDRIDIWGNPLLVDLSGLENLSSKVSSLELHFNPSMVNLVGLGNVDSIGSLTIRQNDALESLLGMDNLTSIDGIIQIYGNDLLSHCHIESVCEFLSNSTSNALIENNATGCNSLEEVMDSCGIVAVPVIDLHELISISPNPAKGAAHLRYLIHDSGYLISDLFGIDGRMIKRIFSGEVLPGDYEIEIDLSQIPGGLYFLRINTGTKVITKKLIIMH